MGVICHVKIYLSRWLSPDKWLKIFMSRRSLLTKTSMGIAFTLTPNGPVVWEVAVRVGVGMCFCKVQKDGREFSRPDETVLTAESR